MGWVYYGSRRGSSIEEFMALARVPCDPRAASALAGSVARRALTGAVGGVAFSVVALAVASVPLALGVPRVFMLPFILVILVFLAVGALVAWSGLRYYKELTGLAEALGQGLLPREEYCGKTLLEVYYSYKAKSIPAGAGV